ncbi:hypothetical protein BH09VER1_BH09VER1_00430 [soil metagenome]
MTQAAQDFQVSFADARRLFELYEAEAASPRVSGSGEVLKRAALIMAVTAFETYLKDYLRETFPPRLAFAQTPKDFKAVFDEVAKKWHREQTDPVSTMDQWTGHGWKELIEKHFEHRLNALNSPKSKIVVSLFDKFLNLDLSGYWKFEGYSYKQACDRLDEIVALRGNIAHVARKTATKHEVSKAILKKYLTFFDGLVSATEKLPLPRGLSRPQSTFCT